MAWTGLLTFGDSNQPHSPLTAVLRLMSDEHADGAAARKTTHEYTQMVGRSFLHDATFAVPPCSANIYSAQVCAGMHPYSSETWDRIVFLVTTGYFSK